MTDDRMSFGLMLQRAKDEELTRRDRAELRTPDGEVLQTWYAADGHIDIPPFEDFLPHRFRGRIVTVGERNGQPAEQVVLEWNPE